MAQPGGRVDHDDDITDETMAEADDANRIRELIEAQDSTPRIPPIGNDPQCAPGPFRC